jgi:hypothetical protein
MKKTAVFVFIAGIALSDVMGQSVTPNYVETMVYQENGNNTTALVTRGYSDGLGRSIQTRARINPFSGYTYGSLVSATKYDEVGRPIAGYKVFPSLNSLEYATYDQLDGEALPYFSVTYPLGQGINYLSETNYSADPLSRVTETGAPGTDFMVGGGHSRQYWYFGTISNKTNSTLIDANGFFQVIQFAGKSRNAIATFFNGQNHDLDLVNPSPNLLLTVTMNENDSISQEIKDMFGRTVATWSCVNGYAKPIIAKYTYDILGNITVEAPPPATTGGQQSLLQTAYTYNALGQLTAKTIPELGSYHNTIERYAYDNAGKLTNVYRDINGITESSILIEYDRVGRVKQKYKEPKTSVSVPEVRFFYDGVKSMGVIEFEDFQNSYLFQCNLNAEEQGTFWSDLFNDDNAKGRLTAAFAINKIPDAQNSVKTYYVGDFYIYDDEGRVKTHYKSIPSVPFQKITYEYDFMGRVKTDIVTTTFSQRVRHYTYDSNGRLSLVSDGGINDSYNNKLVSYDYDEVGRLKTRHIYKKITENSPDENTYNVNYSYTIRDWASQINAGVTNGGSFFKEELRYSFFDNITNPYSFTHQYNGNIGHVSYQYGNNAPLRLNYRYDAANRLVGTHSQDVNVQIHNEEFSYAEDGRFNTKWVGKYNSDPKNYIYYQSTSRLRRLSSQTENENYIYDVYGNMVYDASKKMIATYDWRNLAVKFSFYNSIITSIQAYGNSTSDNGIIPSASLKSICNGLTPLSEVYMIYDADGNRVVKLERKL